MNPSTSQKEHYRCPKCSCTKCEIDEIRAAGGFWTKFFNVENKRFTSLTCEQCKYTEFYKAIGSKAGNVLDFLGN